MKTYEELLQEYSCALEHAGKTYEDAETTAAAAMLADAKADEATIEANKAHAALGVAARALRIAEQKN